MSVGVKVLRQMLQDAAIRFASLRDLESALLLESVAEQFGITKRRSRVRREKWKERRSDEQRENPMADGMTGCRVEGCPNTPTHRPILVFSPDDGNEQSPIKMETALLDVCEHHARNLGTEVYTDNPAIWQAIAKSWLDNDLPAPDPSALLEVQYHPIPKLKEPVDA